MTSARYNIEFSPGFKRKLKKLNPKTLKKLNRLIKILAKNPGYPLLKTHKLKGKLRIYYAFSVESNIRVIFSIINKTTILLIDIGNHDQIYR